MKKSSEKGEPDPQTGPVSLFSEDAFKIASIICQLNTSGEPTREDYVNAVRILEQSQRASEYYVKNRSLSGFEPSQTTTFEELLHLNTVDPDKVNLGKVNSLRGLHDRIKKRFPSSEELERLEAITFSKLEVEVRRRDFPASASERDVFRGLQMAEVRLAKDKRAPYLHLDLIRSSDEITQSGFVTLMEMFFLDQKSYKVGPD